MPAIWETEKKAFSMLSQMSGRFVSTPATRFYSEWSFSEPRNIYVKFRKCVIQSKRWKVAINFIFVFSCIIKVFEFN